MGHRACRIGTEQAVSTCKVGEVAGMDASLGPSCATLRGVVDRREITLDGKTYNVHSAIDLEEGALIQRLVRQTRPKVYLEIGLAYGVSALYAETALRENGGDYQHYILDPLQADWENVGLRVLEKEGFAQNVTFIGKGSEVALPELYASGVTLDMAFIDGWHTFDHALIDFFYINKMLNVGGVVIFDDANWPAVAEVIRHAETYPCYRRAGSTSGHLSLRRVLTSIRKMSRAGLLPTAVALKKVAKDERRWDWYGGR
jgi:predicted O-methyltransferase YrrM